VTHSILVYRCTLLNSLEVVWLRAKETLSGPYGFEGQYVYDVLQLCFGIVVVCLSVCLSSVTDVGLMWLAVIRAYGRKTSYSNN